MGHLQVGLDVWLQDQNVFKCWESMWDVIWHGELGSSLAMLNAGAQLGWDACAAACVLASYTLRMCWEAGRAGFIGSPLEEAGGS